MVVPYTIQTVYAARMKMYAEGGRELTEDLVEQIIHGGGAHVVEKLLDCCFRPDSHEWEMLVKWFGTPWKHNGNQIESSMRLTETDGEVRSGVPQQQQRGSDGSSSGHRSSASSPVICTDSSGARRTFGRVARSA